jgi:hypothetical protein
MEQPKEKHSSVPAKLASLMNQDVSHHSPARLVDLHELVSRHLVIGRVDVLEELWRSNLARVEERVGSDQAL